MARAALESALALSDAPKLELLSDLAAVALAEGDLVRSTRIAREVIASMPEHGAARFTLAISLTAIGANVEALAHFEALNASEGFPAEMPDLSEIVSAELRRLRVLQPAPAKPAAQPVSSVLAPGESSTLRELVWGGCDPYVTFANKVTPGGPNGWYSDHPVFEEVISARRPRRILEVGSMLGASAIHMARLLQRHGIEGEIHCIDTFLGSLEFGAFRRAMLAEGRFNFFDEFLGNVSDAGVAHCINPFPQTSLVASRICAQAKLQFDLIYLDASHEYADVVSDLRAWWPLVAEGGILLGDDFEHPWFSVIRAATEFADEIDKPLGVHRAWASSPLGGRENTKFSFSR